MALKGKNFREEARKRSERVRGALKAEVWRRDFRQLDLEQALGEGPRLLLPPLRRPAAHRRAARIGQVEG